MSDPRSPKWEGATSDGQSIVHGAISLWGLCYPGLVVPWKQPSKPINHRNVGDGFLSVCACVCVGENST